MTDSVYAIVADEDNPPALYVFHTNAEVIELIDLADGLFDVHVVQPQIGAGLLNDLRESVASGE